MPVLEAVYGASGAKSEAGRALSRAELGAALGDLIVAAADTTTNTLQFTLHLVALHPDKQTRLVDELRRELPPDPNSEVFKLAYSSIQSVDGIICFIFYICEYILVFHVATRTVLMYFTLLYEYEYSTYELIVEL